MACVCPAHAALPAGMLLSYQSNSNPPAPSDAQAAVLQLLATEQVAVCSIEAAILNTPLGHGDDVEFMPAIGNVDIEYKDTQWRISRGNRVKILQMLARYPSQKVSGKPLTGTVEYNYAVAHTGRILVTKVRRIP